MEGYPKPRHNYIYTPRYGQRGVLTYAGQQANGAYPSGVAGGAMGGYGYGGGAVGYTGAAYGGAYPRSYYNTAPTYGQTSYVYPPGPTTTTTMYHVANSHVPVATAPPAPMRTACAHTTTREDIQMENRRIATERGAYSARKIKPADARDDDPFWCRERNGEWHLRTFYQIENECYPGQWLMDAELGFLVFHRG
ncbi:uncharacterized protein EKO05_0010214 [Ascochyta rabiei]|uniref:uncharacterized protein n=1 Tax=Didymella rabiei TaxID=5454 RepID=UPI0021F9F274|nr:uncharacterized protein EKO05_0010214 [Ascochyta rabiei]UPX19966.1 hypothetical protein EKO05_0010214 [Ascochyta rabiei]